MGAQEAQIPDGSEDLVPGVEKIQGTLFPFGNGECNGLGAGAQMGDDMKGLLLVAGEQILVAVMTEPAVCFDGGSSLAIILLCNLR